MLGEGRVFIDVKISLELSVGFFFVCVYFAKTHLWRQGFSVAPQDDEISCRFHLLSLCPAAADKECRKS